MAQEIRQRLGVRVRELREERGWSQEVLAELAKLNRSYIGSVERAEHNIGVNNLIVIAKALDVAVSALFEDPLAKKKKEPKVLPEPGSTSAKTVVLHKKVFYQLLKQNATARPELIVIYLERCGAVFI